VNVVRTALHVARKDLRLELRTKDVTVTTALFAILVVVIASLAFYVDRARAREVAPGVLWVTIAFSGLLAMGRGWDRERDGVMRALLLSPAPRAGIFLGKALANLGFMLAVEVLVVPLVGLFFHLDGDAGAWGILVALLFLGTFGFICMGTLFGAMGVRTGSGGLVMSIIVFPLITPALLAAVVATRQLFGGAPLAEIAGWFRILGAFDLVALTVGLVLFDPLTSD